MLRNRSLISLCLLFLGHLVIGTAAKPIVGQVTVRWRNDRAMDISIDPELYQLGLVVAGHITVHGRKINKTFLRAKNQLSDGDEEDSPALGVKPFDLHDLSSAGWKAGDQLAVPGKRNRTRPRN